MTLNNISSKRVLIRFDFNVPMYEGKIINDFRIKQSLATIQLLLKNKNKLIITSHLGRPNEGEYDKNNSLEPIATYLSELLSKDIKFISTSKVGDEIIGHTKILKKTNTLIFLFCELKCNNKIITSATGVWKILKVKPSNLGPGG